MTSRCAAAAASHLHQHVAQCIQTAATHVQPSAPSNIVTCILCGRAHTGMRTRAHTPHGAGNMSEQKQSLASEPVTIIGSTEGFCRGGRVPWKRFRFLCFATRVGDLQVADCFVSSGSVPEAMLHLGRRRQRQPPSCDSPAAAAVVSPPRPRGKTTTAQRCVQDKTAAVGGRRRTFSVGVMEIYAKTARM